jgi:hypothetical protein
MNLVVHDNLFSPELVRAAREQWPAASWKGWVAYDPQTQCKRASDLQTPIPPACGVLLAALASLQVAQWFGGDLIPDLSLHGAGLHEMPTGPGLRLHLDSDTHARLGVERVLSAVLWIHDEWRAAWGGELVLDGGATIRPTPGRVVVFDCRNELHHVEPVTCPADVSRRSLAMFFYSPQVGNNQRPRACFTEAHP